MLHKSRSTIERTRQRFVQEGLDAALSKRARPDASTAQQIVRVGARQPERSFGRLAVRRLSSRRRAPHRRKREFHYTPKHGSWLNLAECELAVLATQRLDYRLPDLPTVRREVAASEKKRNTGPP